MLTAIKYLPLLTSSTVMFFSMMFKLLFIPVFYPTSLFRDIALFFIIYYIVNKLGFYIEKILKNYRKMQ